MLARDWISKVVYIFFSQETKEMDKLKNKTKQKTREKENYGDYDHAHCDEKNTCIL